MYYDRINKNYSYENKITTLVLSNERNKIITDIIIDLITNESYNNDRKILVLSGRCGKNN